MRYKLIRRSDYLPRARRPATLSHAGEQVIIQGWIVYTFFNTI